MLAAIVLTVTPLDKCTAPPTVGRAAQAWLLDLIRAHDPALAAALHEGSGQRPYTVSDLIGAGPVRNGRRVLSPERTGWMRITALTADLSRLLVEQIAPTLPGATIDLSSVALRVESVAATPEAHRWAGQATPQALLTAHSLASRTPRRVTLRFASPTTFRSEGTNVPFPLPALVFGSLVNRWNAFSPIALHPDTRRFAEEMIVASKYTLRSQHVEFAAGERGGAVGCVGLCRYYIRSSDRYWGGVVHTLAAYAFFAGVGAHTTMGLGQAALWDEAEGRPLLAAGG